VNTKELNKLSCVEVRELFRTSVTPSINYTRDAHLQPLYAKLAAQTIYPDFILLPEGERWKGKAHPDMHFWLWGQSVEEVLWKIVLYNA